jgi:hypothetical protein
MANKKTDVTDKPVKKKGKPRGGNNILTDAALNVEPGDNAKYIKNVMQLSALPKIDLRDGQAVVKRIDEFFRIQFENDLKPTVSGLGLALGLDRRRLWEIKTGNYHTSKELSELPTLTTDSVKKAYEMMENLWENYMQNGKINPVSGIFLGKNNFGYQDKQEMVITPNTNNEPDYDVDAIKKRLSGNSPTLLADSSDSDE